MPAVITPSLQTKLQQPSIDNPLINLYLLDCSDIGGAKYYFATTPLADGSAPVWNKITYNLFPIHTEGWDLKADGTPPIIKLSVSNVNRTLLSAVISLGDLVGCKITRYRTFAKYLDSGSTPDPYAYLPPNVAIIQQKQSQGDEEIVFEATSAHNRPGSKMGRVMLTDGDGIYGAFEGLARVHS